MVAPGTLLEGKYEILDKIREGGMGSIYRVRHRLLEEIRVVKVMKPNVVADADLRRRFVEEARTATRLKHPNIGTIHDFAIDESGMAYLVMEFIDGVNASDLLKLHGRPALPLALQIAHQSLLALGFLHRKGIVHRDVAPDNIMLAHDDQGNPVVKLIDLGIAKVAEAPVEATATGVFLGKLKYASPEQYGSLPRGSRLDGRSDLYGMGVVLYELLTGVLPFEGDTVVELLRAHVFSPPRPFAQTDPEGRIPSDLRAIVLKALEKKREDRFENAEAFDRDLLEIIRRYARPEDLEETRAAVRQLRPSREIRVEPATPSAQGHIDRHFGASATPAPSSIGEYDRTAAAPPLPTPAPPPAFREAEVPTTPLPTRPPAPLPRARPWAIPAAVMAAAAVLAAVLLISRRPAASGPSATASIPVAAPTVSAEAASTLPAPAAGDRSVPAETQPTPAAEPSPEPSTAISSAPAPAAAPARPSPGRVKPSPAHRAPTIPPAPPPPSPVAVAAALITTPHPVLPTAEPAHPTAAPAPASIPSVRPAPTDADRIREAVRLYETAQNTLNPDLYARVFPGADRTRIEEAFHNFRSQSVEFEIRKIDVDPRGSSADVSGFETRVAVPRVGNDLRVSAQRVLHFEKRGDAWVITAIR